MFNIKNFKKMIRYVNDYGGKYLKFIPIVSISFVIGFLLSIVTSITILAENSDSCIDLYNDLNSNIKQYINQLSNEYEIPKEYICGIAYNESRFQADALNHNNDGTYDYGIMQINDTCFDFLHDKIGLDSMTDLFNIQTGLKAGVVILDYHKDKVGTDNLMLLRYQTGEGAYEMVIDEQKSFPKSYYKTLNKVEKYKEYFENSIDNSEIKDYN